MTAANARDARRWLAFARRGEFEQAWAVSDRIRARTVRFGDPSQPRHVQQIWNGTPLAGRRVLVRCYHGLGDTIQFARFLPLLAARAQAVTVWAQPTLLPLLRTLDADLALLPLHDGAPGVEFDVDVEIMELAYVFRTTLQTIPAVTPYLAVPPPSRTAAALGPAGERPRVGLVWRAGSWDDDRSIAFATLAPLLGLRGVEWYALQAPLRDDERHPDLTPLTTTTIEALADCMQAMTLVVTIDSMPAHLAGALGLPVWTLLRRDADWRWMGRRGDSPWYPTMRLWRQRRDGDWGGLVAHVADVLSSGVGTPAPTRWQGGAAALAAISRAGQGDDHPLVRRRVTAVTAFDNSKPWRTR